MQALGVAPALQHAAGELVDDLHLAVRHDVVDVALVELLGPQRVLEVVHERRVHVLVHVVDAEPLLHLRHAGLGDGHRALGLVDLVVDVFAQVRHQPREGHVPLGGVGHHGPDRPADPRLVQGEHVGVALDEDDLARACGGGAGEMDPEQLRALVVDLAV